MCKVNISWVKSFNRLKISLLIFEQRCILVYFYGLIYVGDKNILCICKLYFYLNFQGLFLYFIYGKIICNIFELRLFLYYMGLLVCPSGMNIVSTSAFVVERLINICGI